MSHKDGRVVLSAWVEPVLRDYVREAARLSGLEFSRWVERAVRQTMARESADRAMAAARERGECGTWTCGYAPCACDQNMSSCRATRVRKLTGVERKHVRALAGSLLFGGEHRDDVIREVMCWLGDRGWPSREALLRAREVVDKATGCRP